jgi:RNA polymerase sigma factor (sigma-70 family)
MTGTQTGQTRRTLRQLLRGAGTAQLTDRELLERFADSRDDTAFAVLVRRHGAMVLGSCRRLLHNLQDAEDVFQATFLALARRAGTIRRSEAVAGWLHRVASRLALKVRRQSEQRAARERRAAVRSAPDPLAEVSGRELCVALDEELNRLPEKYRLPLLLCCLEGLSRDEAAHRLGWPAGALRGRLERGRELLRRRLGRRGMGLSAGLAGLALTESGRAAVAPGLAAATVEAAVQVASGGTAAVSARAAALLQAALCGGWTRLRLAAAAALAVCVLGAGLSLRGPAASPAPSPAGAAQAARRPAGDDLPGEPLPAGAVARIGTRRFRHEDNIQAVAFLPGGRLVATAAGDTVYLWEAATGKELARLREAVPRVRRNGVPVRSDWIHTLACSPDGTLLAAGHNEGIVRLWDVAARKSVRTWQAHDAPPERSVERGGVMELRFAAGGKALVSSGSDKTLRVWDPATGKEVRRLTGHQGWAGALTVSPDGRLLACSAISGFRDLAAVRAEVRLWDVTTGKEVRRRPAPEKRHAVCLAFSADGQSLAAAFGAWTPPGAVAEIKVWRLATGQETASLKGHTGQVAGLRFAADGKSLRSAGLDGTVRDWDLKGGRELGQTKMHWTGVARARLTPDGKAVVSYGYGALHFWDARTGRELPLSVGSDWPVVADFSPDGKLVATADGLGPARLWDAATGKPVRRLGGFMERFPHFSADGKTVLTIDIDKDGVSGVLRLSEAATGKELSPRKVGRNLGYFAVSADGRFLACGGSFNDPMAHIWDVAAGKEVRAIPTPRICYAFALSPDGRTLAVVGTAGDGGPEDRFLHLWDTTTGKVLHRLEPALENQVFAACFSPDGKTLASCGLGLAQRERGPVLKLWDVTSGRERLRVKPGNNITGLAFSPNGRLLAVLNDGGYLYPGERPQNHTAVRLLDAYTGAELHRYSGHRAGVTSAAFSRDGARLATGSKDTTALLWEIPESVRRGGPVGAPLKPDEFTALWEGLAAADEAMAYRTMGRLAATERSAPLLAERLAVSLRTSKQADAWIAELASKRFAARARAEDELRKFGAAAEGSLRKALAGAPTLEVRRRLAGLLEKQGGPENVRALRAVEVLEHLDTAEARTALEAVAAAAPDARLAGEARAAAARLARRSAAHP